MSADASASEWGEDRETDSAEHTGSEDSLARYLAEVGRFPLLTRAEEVRLARRAAAGDEAAKRRLVESNLRLVVTLARLYRGLGLDDLDLIQEGNLGLMRAVERYDWRREVKFSTFARWSIREALFRAVSGQPRLIRLPARVAEAAQRVNRAESDLAQRLGRIPSCSEVAREAHVEESVVSDLRGAVRAARSLAESVGEDGTTLGDTLADDTADDPAVYAAQSHEAASLELAVAGLRERRRRIVELRYGLDGSGPRTLAEVAGELGLSAERVRHVEATALRELGDKPEIRSLRAAA